jgi:hypothetical protein
MQQRHCGEKNYAKKADWREGDVDHSRSLRVGHRVGEDTLDKVNYSVSDWHKQM